jgi:hypothetical protein
MRTLRDDGVRQIPTPDEVLRLSHLWQLWNARRSASVSSTNAKLRFTEESRLY